MINTIRQIVLKFKEQNPDCGDYFNHMRNTFTMTGYVVTTTTGYKLGISDELISDFYKGMVDKENLAHRVKIIMIPQK